jgi:hypothetical protein
MKLPSIRKSGPHTTSALLKPSCGSFAMTSTRLLTLITRQSPWSRNLWQILRSRNTAYCWVMAGAIAFLAAVLYVPFLRSAFRFGLFIFA